MTVLPEYRKRYMLLILRPFVVDPDPNQLDILDPDPNSINQNSQQMAATDCFAGKKIVL